MRKRILAILMTVALFVVMGPVEMFAEAGNDGEAPVENQDQVVVEQSVEEGIVEEAVEEPAEDPAPVEDAVIEEEPAPAAEEEVVEEPVEEPAPAEEAEPEVTLQAASVAGLALSASAVTTNSATLSWTFTKESGDVVPALKLYNGDQLITTINDPVNTKSYEVTGLDQNTAYTFKAVIGEIPPASVSVTTLKVEVPGFRSVSSYTKVYLRWNKVNGAAQYRITCSALKSPVTVAASKTEWVHAGINSKDIINLYNTKASAKYSGNINGKDRYTYTIEALDAGNKVIAQSTVTGDIVKTLYYKLTFKSAASLTSHSGGKVTSKFKKGQIVYARGFSDGKYIFDYKCKDGKIRTYHTMKIRVKAKLSSHKTCVKSKRGAKSALDYTKEEAEQFVNDRKVTKATTKYMIWANLFTQKEYVFQKSGGKWKIMTADEYGLKDKLMCALPISSGKATMPTATGSTKINRKLKSQHGTPLWNVTKYFSVHGVQKSWPKPGWPESGACVRNQNPNATWIYNFIPKYSRVFVH